MKRLIILLSLISSISFCQTAVKELILTGGVRDTTITSDKVNKGWIRYNPSNGKYRFWNSVNNTWFSYELSSSTPSAQLLEATVDIPSSSVLTLFSSPVTIIPAPGANNYIELISCVVSMDYNSSAYTTNISIAPYIGSAPIASTSNFLNATFDRFQVFDITGYLSFSGTLINESLTLRAISGNPTSGNSPLKVRVVYRILSI